MKCLESDFLIRKGVQKQHFCLDKPDKMMINLLGGSSGFFVSNRRTSNPSFLVIQLGAAKCGAALPRRAWIERLTPGQDATNGLAAFPRISLAFVNSRDQI